MKRRRDGPDPTRPSSYADFNVSVEPYLRRELAHLVSVFVSDTVSRVIGARNLKPSPTRGLFFSLPYLDLSGVVGKWLDCLSDTVSMCTKGGSTTRYSVCLDVDGPPEVHHVYTLEVILNGTQSPDSEVWTEYAEWVVSALSQHRQGLYTPSPTPAPPPRVRVEVESSACLTGSRVTFPVCLHSASGTAPLSSEPSVKDACFDMPFARYTSDQDREILLTAKEGVFAKSDRELERDAYLEDYLEEVAESTLLGQTYGPTPTPPGSVHPDKHQGHGRTGGLGWCRSFSAAKPALVLNMYHTKRAKG
ncbi:hypothetical protein KIPB_002527 [Kipferlia bialata]|uniref:Uncharacterized protein n=1 Tax=Kipferlia bialata TaxID=797122 RepID=A0A9K3GGQ9_9EUKA|nr:hypothetical protein KIPB_002527 [Kipferlia bialata]|eukprot:g2527.t1